jgi:hypothetical protein
MLLGLNFDNSNPYSNLLEEIFNIIDSRRIQQIIASNGIKPLDKFNFSLKAFFISQFFDLKISYIIDEINRKPEVKSFFNVKTVLTVSQVKELIGRFSAEIIEKTMNSILIYLNRNNKVKSHTYLLDATPLDVDYNFDSKKISKENLKNKDPKWGHGTSIGFYIGFKGTFVLDYNTMMPVLFIIHPGSPHDSKIFPEILEQMKKHHLLHHNDKILADRGYYSYENYEIGLKKYHIQPLILTKSNFNIEKLNKALTCPLEYFRQNKKDKENKNKFIKLTNSFCKNIIKRKRIKYIRSHIEDFFKFLKEGLNLKHFHKYTLNSVKKTTILTVLIASLIIIQGYTTKTD